MFFNLNFSVIKSKAEALIINTDPSKDRITPFDVIIFILISLNILSLVLETDTNLASRFERFFFWFETISVAIFTFEYFVRILTCTSFSKYQHPIKGRLKFILSPLMLIDLLAILPFYIHIFSDDILILRVFRLAKIIFRVVKLSSFFPALKILTNSLKRTQKELATSFMMFIILVFISSSLMYFLEHDAQPLVFDSIPKSIYWGVMTFTTVGYGDIYPITPPGQLLASITGIFGIIAFAVPTAIISSALIEEFQKAKGLTKCNSCGKQLDDALKKAFVTNAEKLGVGIHCPFCGDKIKE